MLTIINKGNGRYRLSGEPTDPAWLATRRLDREPWCEITVSGNYVTSYGGEVWPTAWPEYFQPIPDSVSGGAGRIKLTEDGRVVLGLEEEEV